MTGMGEYRPAEEECRTAHLFVIRIFENNTYLQIKNSTDGGVCQALFGHFLLLFTEKNDIVKPYYEGDSYIGMY